MRDTAKKQAFMTNDSGARRSDVAATPAVRAERISLSTRTGTVYTALTFDVASGSLAAVQGPAGSGKTARLLTLAGRMRGWRGRLRVLGVDAARGRARLRGLVGLGLVTGVNDLSESLTGEQHLAEQRIFVTRGRTPARRGTLDVVGLATVAQLAVRDLDAEQRVRLGIALALVGDVRMLVVDDLDRDLDEEQRHRVLGLLRELTGQGLTVVFACVGEASAATADVVVAMDGGRVAPAEVLAHAVA